MKIKIKHNNYQVNAKSGMYVSVPCSTRFRVSNLAQIVTNEMIFGASSLQICNESV